MFLSKLSLVIGLVSILLCEQGELSQGSGANELRSEPTEICAFLNGRTLRVQVSGNRECVRLSAVNLSSQPICFMTYKESGETGLLPYGLIIKARDQENLPIISESDSYYKGFWSPAPFPKGNPPVHLAAWHLAPSAELRLDVNVSDVLKEFPCARPVKDFKLMFFLLRINNQDGGHSEIESPWIRYDSGRGRDE